MARIEVPYHPGQESMEWGDRDCFICRKPIKAVKQHWVHYTNSHEFVTADEPLEVGESQGWWEVGSECAKKLPKEFIKVS